MPAPIYRNSVFVNCPFDEDYKSLFRAMIFTIEYCGFTARCALEVDDAGETRVEKIIRLIRDSRLGVHDISRTQLSNGLPRFNMPYEFGIFTGFKHAGDKRQQRKALLVFDREPFRYQQFLSDIAGQDIRSHADSADNLIPQLRNWLRNQTTHELVGGEYVREQFHAFRNQLPDLLNRSQLTEPDLDNFVDYRRLVFSWIEQNTNE
jgi:hypothetical protein